VEETQQNHEEDHLGEGDDDVARVSDQWEDTQDGGQGSLKNWRSEGKQTLGQPLLLAEVLVSREIVVGDVG